MNPRNHYPADSRQRQAYTFRRQGWPVGEPPSFEEDLTASEGNDRQAVEDFANLVRDLQSQNVTVLEGIRKHYPKLYLRITQEDPSRLLPNNDSGMSAASLRYVTSHLTTRMDSPNNLGQQGFLKWVTQICITIWVYQCDRADWRELKRSASDFILGSDFTPCVDDAAYLTIIAFVLGGDLDQMLAEYVDAVVWDSNIEFACEIEPLRNTISRQRRALIEFMHNSFSHVLTDLAYSGDRQLWLLGQRLHARLMALRPYGLDLRRNFAGTQDFNNAHYPAAFELAFLEALRAEQEALGFRANARASKDAIAHRLNPRPSRFGSGAAFMAALTKGFQRNRHQSAQRRLESILRDARRGIAEQRRMITDAVQELIRERDASLEADSVAEEQLAYHGVNGSAESSYQ